MELSITVITKAVSVPSLVRKIQELERKYRTKNYKRDDISIQIIMPPIEINMHKDKIFYQIDQDPATAKPSEIKRANPTSHYAICKNIEAGRRKAQTFRLIS